jgi:hypothetical protein
MITRARVEAQALEEEAPRKAPTASDADRLAESEDVTLARSDRGEDGGEGDQPPGQALPVRDRSWGRPTPLFPEGYQGP